MMRGAVLLVFAAMTGLGAAQDSVESIRALYAWAGYESALAAADRLRTVDAGSRRIEVDRYVVLCLVAVGRMVEADQVIEGILADNPLYQPAADMPPRICATFSAVRGRVVSSPCLRPLRGRKSGVRWQVLCRGGGKLNQVVQLIDGLTWPTSSS